MRIAHHTETKGEFVNNWTKLKLKVRLCYLHFMPNSTPITESRAAKIRIQLEMDAALIKQFQDANRKQKKSFHWGNIGWQIENAASECELILRSSDAEDLDQYMARVLPAITDLASSYRLSNIDESGYALGTVRELEQVLIEKSHHGK